MIKKFTLLALATAFCSTAAVAQTEQTAKTSSGILKDFVTDLVLNGNNVILKFEQEDSKTYSLLTTGIDLKYDEQLAVKDIEAERRQEPAGIYDLQGRRVEASQLKKGIYIVNGKKQVVK